MSPYDWQTVIHATLNSLLNVPKQVVGGLWCGGVLVCSVFSAGVFLWVRGVRGLLVGCGCVEWGCSRGYMWF
ncbi:hypothetical protein, partial [Pseudomonas syringae group genomosp. 7]|uniref:hypothetical protein n=1 Tax=Pseudomonas syringae group genomosp. 7 TaxID=251699 RepID=UPI0037700C63